MATDLTLKEFKEGAENYFLDIKDFLSVSQYSQLQWLYNIALEAFDECGDMPNYIFLDGKLWQNNLWFPDGLLMWSCSQNSNKKVEYEDVVKLQKFEAFCTIFLYGNGLFEKHDKYIVYANSFEHSGLFDIYSVKDVFNKDTALNSESTSSII